MLEDYEPVSARLDRWLKAHGEQECRVVTDLVHYLQDHCVFRAELWLDGVLIATGWAEEVRGQGNVNRTSHVENCETSAVGRALANAGMAGSDFTKRPSREEMAKVSRLSPGGSGGMAGGASPAQIGKIRAMSKALGSPPPPNMDEMSKAQASKIIEELIAKQEARNGEDPF